MVTFLIDLYSFSPNGIFLACWNHTERQILVSGFPDVPVDTLAWSQDSGFLAVVCKKYAVVNIFSVTDSTWKCRITLGPEGHGLESFAWGRDARHLVCVAGDISFLSIWSLRSKQVRYIKDLCPIPAGQGLSYSPDGRHLAIAHVSGTGTYSYFVAIYSTVSWECTARFSVICKDLSGISWCPVTGSEYLGAWDSNLFSNLYVYSTRTGALIKQYSPYGLTSSGFSSIEWSTTGQFLVATSQNKRDVHVLNGLTFGVLIHDTLEPERSRDLGTGQYEIFWEANKTPSLGMNKYTRLSKWPEISIDAYALLQLQVHSQSPPPTTLVSLSPSGSHFACTTRFYPRILWIYDLLSTVAPVAVLIHQHPVADFAWNPTSPNLKLAIICHSPEDTRGLLYFWESPPSSSSSKKVASTAYMHNTTSKCSFSGVQWSPQGDILVIRDDTQRIHLLTNL